MKNNDSLTSHEINKPIIDLGLLTLVSLEVAGSPLSHLFAKKLSGSIELKYHLRGDDFIATCVPTNAYLFAFNFENSIRGVTSSIRRMHEISRSRAIQDRLHESEEAVARKAGTKV